MGFPNCKPLACAWRWLLFLIRWERKEVLVKIYITVNHLRIFLSSSCHLVIWSLGHSVTWVTQSLCHLVTRSLSHSVTQSFSHLVTQSCSHSIIQSLGHLVTWFLGHLVTWSFGHSVTSHYSSIFNVVTDWLTNWRTTLGSTDLLRRQKEVEGS